MTVFESIIVWGLIFSAIWIILDFKSKKIVILNN